MLKDKLKEFRMDSSLSQQQVADLLNIHRSTYSYYELGKTEPSLDNIRMLSKIFGVSLYDLLEIERPAGSFVRDDFLYPDAPTRVGDLSSEEKMLVMRYRLLTHSQREALLSTMGITEDLLLLDKKDE